MGRRCWSLWLLPLVLGLQINQADSSSANKTIRIGYLVQYMNRAGAINVAIAQARQDGLLRDYNFRWADFNAISQSVETHLYIAA